MIIVNLQNNTGVGEASGGIDETILAMSQCINDTSMQNSFKF